VTTGIAKRESKARPLVVDLDGTLVPIDLLVEQFASVAGKDWRAALRALGKLRQGKSALKTAVAESSQLQPSLLPYDPTVIALVRKAREDGRQVYLATASHQLQAQAIADHLGLFDGVFATTADVNLAGPNKARALVEHFGDGGFDYVGNHSHDLDVWKHAHAA
jgi:phosphoserine phosphatase